MDFETINNYSPLDYTPIGLNPLKNTQECQCPCHTQGAVHCAPCECLSGNPVVVDPSPQQKEDAAPEPEVKADAPMDYQEPKESVSMAITPISSLPIALAEARTGQMRTMGAVAGGLAGWVYTINSRPRQESGTPPSFVQEMGHAKPNVEWSNKDFAANLFLNSAIGVLLGRGIGLGVDVARKAYINPLQDEVSPAESLMGGSQHATNVMVAAELAALGGALGAAYGTKRRVSDDAGRRAEGGWLGLLAMPLVWSALAGSLVGLGTLAVAYRWNPPQMSLAEFDGTA